MEIKDLTGKLVLRHHLGEGEYGGKKVTTSITNSALIINYDNKQYGVEFINIIKEVLDELEKEGKYLEEFESHMNQYEKIKNLNNEGD